MTEPDLSPAPNYGIRITSEDVKSDIRRWEHKDGSPVLWPECIEGNCKLNECNPQFVFPRLLRELHAEMQTEDDDDAAEERANVIRDKMDPVWWRLTDDEREAMRKLSAKLYDEEPPSLDPLDRELGFVPPISCSAKDCTKMLVLGSPFPKTGNQVIQEAGAAGWAAEVNGPSVKFTCGECL